MQKRVCFQSRASSEGIAALCETPESQSHDEVSPGKIRFAGNAVRLELVRTAQYQRRDYWLALRCESVSQKTPVIQVTPVITEKRFGCLDVWHLRLLNVVYSVLPRDQSYLIRENA